MSPTRPATWADFQKVTAELEESRRQRVEPISEPELEKEPDPPVTPWVDDSAQMADSASPDDISGVLMPEPSESVLRRFRPTEEPFLGRVADPDELVERTHLAVLGADFPVQLGAKPEIDQPAIDLANSYGAD